MLGTFVFLSKRKKKSIYRNANEMFINTTATIPPSGIKKKKRGRKRKQKIQIICNRTILTNVTAKHTRFSEENPFLFMTKLSCNLPHNHKSSSVLRFFKQSFFLALLI